MREVYTLENEYLRIKVTSLGASLLSLYDKKLNTDLVGGFDSVEEYINRRDIFFGAMVGRCANRIKNGMFSINGVTYQTEINNGHNSLHGGSVQFSFVEFKLIEKDECHLTFSYFSKDLEAGYPGDLNIEVTYELKNKEVIIKFSGVSNKDTLFNMTNHTYFNLSGGKENILDTELLIPAKKVSLTDKENMVTGKELNVEGTAFDFRQFRKIKDSLSQNHPNMFGGIDHNFIEEDNIDDLKAAIRNDKVSISIHSDLPDVQVYTGNFFDGFIGRNGHKYDKYHALAIEPQYVPNAINFDTYKKPLLKAFEKVTHYIRYKVED